LANEKPVREGKGRIPVELDWWIPGGGEGPPIALGGGAGGKKKQNSDYGFMLKMSQKSKKGPGSGRAGALRGGPSEVAKKKKKGQSKAKALGISKKNSDPKSSVGRLNQSREGKDVGLITSQRGTKKKKWWEGNKG